MTGTPAQELDLAAAVTGAPVLQGAPNSADTICATLPLGKVDADALVRGLV